MPARTITASRWHSPPNPALVFTTAMAVAPAPSSSSASRVVAMSPSRTPIRTELPSWRNVRLSNVVLPAPGEDMRFTVRTPARANASRLASATRSFSERRFSRISTRTVPVAA